MNMQYTDGVRDDTSLIIGIAGASGSGKTVSALLLAEGLAGEDGEVAFIDTEGGRARHYFPTPSDTRSREELRKEFLFRVKYLDMKPPYNPRSIWAAINEAIDKVGAKVIVVDSTSDEWEGVGGLHDMHIAEMARLAKKPYDSLQDWELHKYNFPAWAVPKAEHKQYLMKNLRQVRAHVIFCFRANELTKPVEVIDDKGRKKMTVQNVGWQPVCEKNMLYDLTISFMVTPDQKGIPLMQDGKFYGKLNPPYSKFFQPGKQVSIETGTQLRAWARGETEQTSNANSRKAPHASASDAGETPPSNPSSASVSNQVLLVAYHQLLDDTQNRDDLIKAHTEYRPQFEGRDEPVQTAAKYIFGAHQDRIIKGMEMPDIYEAIEKVPL